MSKFIRGFNCIWLLLILGFFAFPYQQTLAAPKASHAPARYEEFNGKIIRNITFQVHEIFDQPDNALFRQANALKISTKEQVLRRELLFKEGDVFDHFQLEESERALRSLKYLRKIEISPVSDGNFLDLHVQAQDTWTFIPQLSYSSGVGTDRASVGVSESDVMGLGKRAEILFAEEDSRQSIEGLYDDSRLWGSFHRLLLGYFDRNDGERSVLLIGRPFRSLLDDSSWAFNSDISDTIGRLFENNEERFIYRQDKSDIDIRYTFARGDPEEHLLRYTVGYSYAEADFSQATLQDFDDINLDPNEVSQDPSLLAEDRRYTGPLLAFQSIKQDFISMNYIDRFERVEDYNLGSDSSFSAIFAGESLGSLQDAAILTGNHSRGLRFNSSSFLRGEIGFASRRNREEFQDSLLRAELRYYNVLGMLKLKERPLGRHTLAVSMFLDYGNELDKDRELLIGGDNAIRGYEARTFTGDKRIAMNIEDRMHFIDDAFSLVSVGAAAFLDVGASTDESFGNMLTDEIYSNVGLGLRLAFPRSSGERVVRLDVALPLREGPDGSDRFEPRIIFAGGLLFGSRLRSETIGPEKASIEVGFDR